MTKEQPAWNIPEIREMVFSTGFAQLEDQSLKQFAIDARNEYLSTFRDFELHPPSQRFKNEDLINSPWRKLAIGSSNGLGQSYAQLLQTTYFAEVDSRFPSLTRLWGLLLALRNELSGLEPNFGSDAIRDGFWNACRIHHYPIGGGFMAQHRDTHFPAILSSCGLPYLQVMMLLSNCGVDFSTGGGYVIGQDDKAIDLESESGIGKIVIFDGSVRHGVADIDRHEVLNFDSSRGRIAAFVNLYETQNR